MSRSFSSCIALFVISLAFVFGCSKAPEQYSPSAPPLPERDLSDIPATIRAQSIDNKEAGRLLGEKIPMDQEEKDRRMRLNTYAPMLYKVGAANLTFDTTYKEAQDILTDPLAINASGSQAQYQEGVIVNWRLDEPRIPTSIIVIIGYQGTLEFPAPWGKVRIDQSFSDSFSTGIDDPGQDPKALNLLRSLYNFLEDENIDCVAEGKCRLFLNEGGSFVVFDLPNAYFLFGNNERRKLVQVSLFKSKDAGLFRNPIDLLSGKVQVPQQAEQEGAAIRIRSNDFDRNNEFGLGQTFAEIKQAAGLSDPQIDSYSTYYSILLGQGSEILLAFEKSDFNSPKPLPTDRLETIALYAKYTLPIKFASQFIQVEPDLTGGVQFSPLAEILSTAGEVDVNQELVEDTQEPTALPDDGSLVDQFLDLVKESRFLSTKAPILARNFQRQRSFVENLFSYMQTQAAQVLGPDWSSYPTVSGKYDDRYSREVTGSLFFLNPKTSEGKIVEVIVNETSGDLIFASSIFTKDFQKKTYFAGMNGMVAGQNHLMGFTLGDTLYATDFEYARLESTSYGDTAQQATIRYEDPQLGTLISRGSYKRDAESSVLYDTGNERNITNQVAEVFEVQGATLGVNQIGEEEIDGKIWKKYEINVIETTSLLGEVKGLCGIPEFNAKIGVYDLEFQEQFIELPAKARRQRAELLTQVQAQLDAGKTTAEIQSGLSEEQKTLMSYSGCPAVSPMDGAATNLRRAYYFPNHHLKLVFGRRELAKVGIYKKPSSEERGE